MKTYFATIDVLDRSFPEEEVDEIAFSNWTNKVWRCKFATRKKKKETDKKKRTWLVLVINKNDFDFVGKSENKFY